MKLYLDVYLNGIRIGSGELPKRSGILGPRTIKQEAEAIITTVCFLRKDDLLRTHDISEFTVKGSARE